MAPLLTVITACLPARAQYLPFTAASIPAFLHLPDREGWGVEWVLVYDGDGDVPDLPVSPANPTPTIIRSPLREGVSAARNRGLQVSRGDWILNLDADDELILDGLQAVATALQPPLKARRGGSAGLEYGWAAGCLQNEDGTLYPPLTAVSDHQWEAGELVSNWTIPMAFHPGVAWMRRESLLSVGGWPALTAVEDKLPLFLVSEDTAGITVPAPTHRYRRHVGQSTGSEAHAATRQYATDYTCEVLTARRRRTDPDAAEVRPVRM